MSKITKKKLILGVTGGIATGKTTVVRMLAKTGIPTICSDDLAHDCIRRGKPAYRAILTRFGRSILGADRQIDRRKLGKIVFSSPKKRRTLERIVHPCVAKGLRRFIKSHREIMILDIPLLFEAGYETWVDKTIVVFSTPSQQIARLMSRNRLSRSEAKQRLVSQMPIGQKCRKATLVLDNSGTPAFLRRQVQKLVSDLKRT